MTKKIKPLNIQGTSMYHTYKTQEELEKYIDSHIPSEAILLHTGMGLAVNMIVHLMCEHANGKAIAKPTPPLLKSKTKEVKND